MELIPTPQIHIDVIAPEIILTITAIILLMAEVYATTKGKDHLGYIALGGVVIAGILETWLQGDPWMAFSGMYAVDNFSTFFKIVCLIGTGLTILLSVKYIEDENVNCGEYYAMLLFATIGMFIMISGEDMMTIFVGLELMSVSLYVLAGFTRTRLVSNEASMKYFILGALASAILLYGIALVYGITGTTQLSAIGEVTGSGGGAKTVLIVGIVMITVGFSFKIAAAPFHMWAPDVYQGAPAPVSGFMSAGPKAAAFAAFIRVFAEAFPAMRAEWWVILWALAIATMTVGNVAALLQNNVKRMLAYSSIAHAGYILVGFCSANEQGSSGALFYMLVYTLMNIGAFAVVTVVAGKGEERVTVSDYNGLGFKHPLLAFALAILLFSLAGIPPTAGFIGKLYIFMAAMDSGYYYLTIIGVLNSVLAVFYYLRLTIAMYMKEEGEEQFSISVAAPVAVALAISVTGVLWLGILPGKYIEIAKSAFLSF